MTGPEGRAAETGSGGGREAVARLRGGSTGRDGQAAVDPAFLAAASHMIPVISE